MTGPVKEEDVLVLRLDSLEFDTHADAVQTVLGHFGQVGASLSGQARRPAAGHV